MDEESDSERSESAEDCEDEASAELLADLRQMVNEAAFSDVVFVCNDGIRVHALRKFLAGRSDVLKSMLMNGMAESGLYEIELPEFSSPGLLSVFEFLYTGTLLKYQPQSWTKSCAIVSASRFFILPNLERIIIRNFMHTQISHDLTKAATQLTKAVGLKLYSSEMDGVLEDLLDILSSNWSDSVYVQSLSEDAFTYLLAESSQRNLEYNCLSFEEYLRFRQVIRWWIYQGDLGYRATEELLNLLVPDEKGALCLCRDIKNLLKGAASLSDDWNSFWVDAASRKSAIRLVSTIDCRRIHPVLLEKVVEPLQIISEAEMQKSFRFHALRRDMIFASPEYGWEHGESHSTQEQGHVIRKTESNPGIGLAVMTAEMSRSYGVYQWRFVLEELCHNFCEVGTLQRRNRKLDGERLSDQFRARVLTFQGLEAYVNWQRGPKAKQPVPSGTSDFIGTKVKKLGNAFHMPIKAFFNYNASTHTCSLSINGQDFGIVWKNLPTMCPAVSLGTSSQGRVRIELVSGFDIL